MGVSSSSMVGAKGYSQRAQVNKKFADSILTMMFKQTDFQDLLTLTNLSACPKYVFTTAQALSAMFTKMKVVPIKGKSQDILFAPLSTLAPSEASVKGVDLNKGKILAQQMAQRNQLCMEIAYFYIRIFQIYAALALTVMDADPTRRLYNLAPTGVAPKPTAPFVLKGGKITGTGYPVKTSYTEDFKRSPFVWFNDFFFSETRPTGEIYFDLKSESSASIKIIIKYDPYNDNFFSKGSLTGIFVSGTLQQENVIIEGKDDDLHYSLLVNNNILFQINKGTKNFEILDEDKEKFKSTITTQPKTYFNYRMRKIFFGDQEGPSSYLSGYAPPSIQQVSSGYSAPTAQIAPGKSVFDGFDQLKKIYSQKTTSPTFKFPKAYCIGRAMTLMNPIFKEELAKKNEPTIVQVCSQSLDFEVGGDNYMPRARNVASANIYFRSFIALFYDSFTIGGGTIQFTQTEDGASKLIRASKLLAQLYQIKPEDQSKFLLGSIQFPSLNLCDKTTTSTSTISYIQDPKFRDVFFMKYILPMLQFQEQHTAKVNNLLKKLFTMRGEQLLLSPKLLTGGRVELNVIGYEAHQLLLEYYLKSEAFYIKACLALQQNKQMLKNEFR